MSTLPRILEAAHRSLVGKCPRRSELILSSAKAASTNARRGLLVGSCVARERCRIVQCNLFRTVKLIS